MFLLIREYYIIYVNWRFSAFSLIKIEKCMIKLLFNNIKFKLKQFKTYYFMR